MGGVSLFTGVKASGLEADRSLPSSAKIKNALSKLPFPLRLHGLVLNSTRRLLLPYIGLY
jgi:hypothetical protein